MSCNDVVMWVVMWLLANAMFTIPNSTIGIHWSIGCEEPLGQSHIRLLMGTVGQRGIHEAHLDCLQAGWLPLVASQNHRTGMIHILVYYGNLVYIGILQPLVAIGIPAIGGDFGDLISTLTNSSKIPVADLGEEV